MRNGVPFAEKDKTGRQAGLGEKVNYSVLDVLGLRCFMGRPRDGE